MDQVNSDATGPGPIPPEPAGPVPEPLSTSAPGPAPTPQGASSPAPQGASSPAPTASPPAPGSLADPGDVAAARAAARGDALRRLGLREPLSLTVVRQYRGKQQKDVNGQFAAEAELFAALGYVVTSQSWAQGQWGCGAWLIGMLAILLIGLGLLIILYMLIVKPAGTLTVTYALQA